MSSKEVPFFHQLLFSRGHLSSGLSLVAIDFDKTYVNVHTLGRWSGSAESLAENVRPFFVSLIKQAVANKVVVAIVTSSMQVALITKVLSLSLGPSLSKKVIVKGMDDTWSVPLYQALDSTWQKVLQWRMKPTNNKKQGKIDHFISLAYTSFKSSSKPLRPQEVLYFDDDPVCVLAGRSNGFQAFQVRDNFNGLNTLNEYIESGELPDVVSVSNSKACSIM
ncbi:hypothetical protein TL16_g02309 [Triparma laevis f. inornata]|uniref:Uncharacterized protein n=2 Tax=Triparma laevis TaxID=1534972 RepID=A0A9W7AVS1_9STRA|nr:hypothetical protein TL16_g02309 [Triparma laevis f. inornata]GMH78824.1 hypothetical protein TrLO_g8596 [Triparma laevis f. longispina]